ncbi:rod shape-determining protein RodA [Actinoallomurus sp. NPDC052308]|uniref:rod shape-determining protein RodA n=1 Tax=Actinoallomurus sp. NPDC052308 TaxID=3155530 RepID=UPI0034480540
MISEYGGALGRRRSLPARLLASPARRLDWILLLAVLALSVIGALLVYSATRADGSEAFLKKHLLNLAIGLVLGGVTTALDYRLLRAYAPIVYGAACLGLAVVLTPIGATVNGSHSWIVVGGGFQIQPSEFAKVGMVVLLAMILGEPRDGEIGPGRRDILLALTLAALPAGLVMLQPDLGTTLVFATVIIGVLAMSGAPKRWVGGLVGAAMSLALTVWSLHLLKPYQVHRFTAFADPSADPQGAGYNAQQARIAVGSGGVFGNGLFHGEQTNGHFVPEQHTDFIFTVAGEELGFVGAALIIALLGVVLWRGLRIAREAADLFGGLVATGVVCWLAFQTFENIGMTVGIMPITGLPLPFVSYGGSASFANFVGVGLLQTVHLRHNPYD